MKGKCDAHCCNHHTKKAMLEYERIISKGIIPKSFFEQETRDGFLVTSKRKKVWAIELDLLFEVAQICERHNIQYYLFGGCLLGAIRHKGFIPWDDDIDIMMRRRDYEQFAKLAQDELEDPYFLQTPLTDGCWCDLIRVCNSNTTGIRKILQHTENVNKGIFIDIFPLDAVSNNPFFRKIRYKTVALSSRLASYYSFELSDSWKSKLISKILHWPILKIDIKKWYIHVNKLASSTHVKNPHKMGIITRIPLDSEKICWNKECFDGKIKVPFEFFSIEIPEKYDEILKTMYGDYMVFPPVEARGKWHNTVFDPDTPFEVYCLEHKHLDNETFENM